MRPYNPRHVPTIHVLWKRGREVNVLNPHLRPMFRHTATIVAVRG